MTIRELYKLLAFMKDGTPVEITTGGCAGVVVCLGDELTMAAYGDFIVQSVMAVGEDKFEIEILTKPVRAGEV